MIVETQSLDEQFKKLDGERQDRLTASAQFAYYTIPSLFPDIESTEVDDARGVGMLDAIGSAVLNHFSNKLVTTMFSPNQPFFRIGPAAESEDAVELERAQSDDSDPAAQQQAQDTIREFRKEASRVEKRAVQHLESIGYRTAATQTAKVLVATGDAVLYNPGDGARPSVYTMRDYVAVKDLSGTDTLLIMRDTKAFGTFDADLQEEILRMSEERHIKAQDDVTLYTAYELQDDGRYAVMQGTNHGDFGHGEQRRVPQDAVPHTHLSWNLTRGENYGRGLVEDYSGAFHMIDALSRTIAQLAARIAAQKIMVDPQAGIDVDALNSADSSTYVSGRKDGISTEKLVDPQDIVALDQLIQGHKRQISAAFLYQSGNTRDAERVTAEEIRENAAELEIAHGGVYSRFAADWQAKAAKEAVAEVDGVLSSDLDTRIITGMDSLSRQGEMQAVRVWIQDLGMLNTVPEHMQSVIKPSEFAEYTAVQRGVNHDAFVKTDTELTEERQQQRDHEMQMMQMEHAAKQQPQMTQGV